MDVSVGDVGGQVEAGAGCGDSRVFVMSVGVM